MREFSNKDRLRKEQTGEVEAAAVYKADLYSCKVWITTFLGSTISYYFSNVFFVENLR